MDHAGAKELIERHAIETVECCFPDSWGVLTGRRMPAATFLRVARSGMSMPNAPFAWDLLGHIDPTPYASADTGFPNMFVRADLGTLRVAPWAARTALCLFDAFVGPDGPEHPLDSRAILRRAVARLNVTGYVAWTASELEFYLCDEQWQRIYADTRCWSMERGSDLEPVLGEIRATLLRCDVPVESSQIEYGPGQMEVNVEPGPPLETADRAAIFKYVVKILARRHGLRATFMAMPFQDGAGSGHHLHHSLRAIGSAANLFARVDDDAGPIRSVPMRRYLAGVLAHLSELTLVNLPTVNAYKRLEDYTFAPNRVSWGIDNRTVAVRVPLADGPSTRLELRAASSDANPYLIMAGAVASGADGLARELDPPPVTEGDAYTDPDLELLPTSLATAAQLFERSPFCKGLYGETFVETFTILARREQAAFLHHVTDWERDRYLAQA